MLLKETSRQIKKECFALQYHILTDGAQRLMDRMSKSTKQMGCLWGF